MPTDEKNVTASDEIGTAGLSSISLNGSAPPCEHLNELTPIVPGSDVCAGCRARAQEWKALAVCLTCGWVACTDSSPNQHAKAHYEETDHPLTAGLEPDQTWRWCYIHQRAV